MQLVGAGRVLALELGLGEHNTVDRLRAAASRGVWTEQEGRHFVDAGQILMRLRLGHQLDQLARGDRPDNRLVITRLSRTDRLLLRDALQTVAEVQRLVRGAATRRASADRDGLVPRRRPAPALAQLVTDGFVALDLETTGLDSRRDAVVSLAAIPFVDRRPLPGLHALVNPGRPIPEAATRIHGLDDAAMAGAPRIADVLPRLAAACGRRVLVGDAIDFDLAVLTRDARVAALPPLSNPALDTRDLALVLEPRREATLEDLAERFGVPVAGRHTAAGDATAAGMILLGLLPEFEAQGVRTLHEPLKLQRAGRRRRAI
jgi:DNA polymerase III epsilon subunit-like protein